MSITIRTNIASLLTQRRLGQSTYALQQSFTRLSSGLRINKASDDASGLAISSDLKVDARVFAQGIRNLNDGISMLNIADGALHEASNILIRIQELAAQSATGTLGSTQRQALNEEAEQLVEEYNRIVASTQFNDLPLFDEDLGTIRIQAGYGIKGSLNVDLGAGLGRTVGDGTFQDAVSYSSGGSFATPAVGDIDNDGDLDVITATTLQVNLNDGSGVMTSTGSLDPTAGNWGRALTDLNGDGKLDLVSGDIGPDVLTVYIGNGNGTFQAGVTYEHGLDPLEVFAADLNNDGKTDIVSLTAADDVISIFMGNGDGSFTARATLDGLDLSSNNVDSLVVADVNGDDKLDLIAPNDAGPGRAIGVFLGHGDGTFGARTSFATAGLSTFDIELADLNGDGALDIIDATLNEGVYVRLGNGDGSFQGRVTIIDTTYTRGGIELGDLNGDNQLDIVVGDLDNSAVSVFLGSSDATFSFAAAYSTSNPNAPGLALADMNDDGALDIIFDRTSLELFFGNTQTVNTLAPVDLTTQQSSREAIEEIDEALSRVASEVGSLGSLRSRMDTALKNLEQRRENFLAAASQITDVDVAEETATLVRNQILQQAGAAILAQANQAPQLALLLLDTT